MGSLGDKLREASRPTGRALVATQPIAPGETILPLEGRIVPTPDRLTIQLGPDRHLAPEGHAWALVNHACTPNARIALPEAAIVAIAPIAPGEEITFDYLTTEWELAAPFACTCGAPACRGVIRGFRHLSPDQRRAIRPLLSPCLRALPAASA